MYRYRTNCVNSDGPSINAMVATARDISRKTFRKYVDPDNVREIEEALGYAKHPKQGLTMAADYHVSYHRSTYRGAACVYFCNSAIEYIFTTPTRRREGDV